MVLSAELYGSQTTESLDHSGPLLVLCAACERELNARTFERVKARFPSEHEDGQHVLDDHATLGAAIQILDRARRIAVAMKDNDEARINELVAGAYTPSQGRGVVLIGRWLLDAELDLTAIKKLLKDLRQLNEKFRRPAAHDRVVEADEWSQGRALILGHEKVLDALVAAFPR